MSESKAEHKYTFEQLAAISCDSKALARALEEDPQFVIRQDDLGQTILHHVARLGLGPLEIKRTADGRLDIKPKAQNNSGEQVDVEGILSLLFEGSQRELIDFNIQTNTGRTPLHIALISRGMGPSPWEMVLRRFLQEAQTRNSRREAQAKDVFELLDGEGYSIYHRAAQHTTLRPAFLIDLINEYVQEPSWNHLSAEGQLRFIIY